MKIGIFCNKTTNKYLPIQDKLFRLLNTRGFAYSVYETMEDLDEIDVLVVLGGDGTILKVATEAGKKGIPVLGINAGNLGFLTEFEGDETERAVALLTNSEYTLQKRSVLEIAVNGKQFYALNEVFFQRHYSEESDNNVVNLIAKIDGMKVDEFIGDGVIVSTPTGSTAYSLSAGGAILTPDLHAFILTPVCAHSLHNRPIVYADHSVLQMELGMNESKSAMYCDGKFVCVLTKSDRISVQKAPFMVEFISSRNNFFDKLLIKLNKWSV